MIGQKIMVGFRQRATPPSTLLADIGKGRVGGVILFGENNGGRNGYSSVVQQLQRAAKAGGQPPLLISIDQEGGLVRRISAAPPNISPNEMGRQGTGTSQQQGLATGRDLRNRGITVDLAPVVDVPSSPDSFLGDRTFGTTPGRVSATAGAFAAGLQAARVAATAKHYPGLGTTGARNTDEAPVTVDTSLAELTRRAKPFHALADGGVKLVMVSSATYSAIDPSRPAVLSRRVVHSRLRSFFGKGVVISDDLGTPALASYGGQVPVLASNAGVDILLYVDTAGRDAYSAMVNAYRSGELPASRLKASYRRIMALKKWVAGG
jgi:beta-N-acetylhexosaminidase